MSGTAEYPDRRDSARTPLLNDFDHQIPTSLSETSEDELNYLGHPSTNASLRGERRGEGADVPRQHQPCFVYMLTMLSAIGGFLFGYDTGVISGAMLILQRVFNLSPLWEELVVSATIGAAAIFAVVGGYTNDWLGRKPTILLASFVFTVGSVVLAAAVNTAMLLIGRIIVGIGIGFASTTVPMYIAESAPPDMRGKLVTLNNIFITGGQFVASLVDGAFSFDAKNGWRYMLGLAGVPAAIQFLGFLFMPESPRWLVGKGREEKALSVLQVVRGKPDVQEELDAIKETCEEARRLQAQMGSSVLLQMLRTPHVRKALVIGCGLQMFQQICGINTVMYYSATIITMSGVKSASVAIWLASVTAGTNFVFTFVGFFLVDRIGRRPLTLGSLSGTLVSLGVLAVGFQLAAQRAPPVTYSSSAANDSSCYSISNCNGCMQDSRCGFCYVDALSGVVNGSCDQVGMVGTTINQDAAAAGRCSVNRTLTGVEWAYDYCPTDVSWVAFFGLILYLAFFAPGMGPMPWTVNSEIYPLWARSTGNAVATTTNWVFNLMVSMTFLTLTQKLTRYGAFWLYTGLLHFPRKKSVLKKATLKQKVAGMPDSKGRIASRSNKAASVSQTNTPVIMEPVFETQAIVDTAEPGTSELVAEQSSGAT